MTESSSSGSVTFEICPLCSQRTASHLFREWKNVRCCFLCAQRSAKDEKDEEAIVLDQKYHGMGLWKHVITVAALTVIGIIVRMIALHYMSGPQN